MDKSYVVDNCIAFLRDKRKKEISIEYIADVLMCINNNIAEAFGGRVVKESLHDVIHPKPVETRTSREIKDTMKEKLAKLGRR